LLVCQFSSSEGTSGGPEGPKRSCLKVLPRKAVQVRHVPTVPQTDTGRQVEDTKVFERTLVKELGNLTP
jgi:hypothetical protein